MKKVFSRGEKAAVGLQISRGSAAVTFDDSPRFTFPEDLPLVATAECFLDSVTPGRITDFYLSTTAEVKKIPFYRIREHMRDFQFGFDTNRYLARLLDFSNQYLIKREEAAKEHHEDIHWQAIVFNRITHELNTIWELQGSVEAFALANKAKSSPLFEYAKQFELDQSVATISLPSGEDSEPFVKQFPQGAPICQEGDPGQEVFALLSGKISVRRGRRLLAQISNAGEAFGELSLFLDGVRTASLVAEEESSLLVVPRTQLGRFFESRADFFTNVASTLTKRIERNVEKIYALREEGINTDPERLEEKIREGDKSADEVYGLKKLVIHLGHLAKRSDNQALQNLYDDVMNSPDTARVVEKVS